jgi:bifunctional oligoribonuclease and PAP phosphatase NrnA
MNERRKSLLQQAAAQIRKANSIVLACHVRPDADALGSLLGLALGLNHLGKRVEAISADGVPETYRFLPEWRRISTQAVKPADLGIGLDSDGAHRMGSARDAVLGAPVVIDIDHHTGPEPFGDVQVVDRTAAATGELIYQLLLELEVPITQEIATCLLAAILTDTGSFRFTNVTSETLEIAAALVAAGAHPAPIHEAVYGRRSFAESLLLGRLLSGLQRSGDGKVVWACLSQPDFQALGLATSDTEGFVDQVRMVQDSEVAIFFREERSGEIRVSLRSRGNVNVARVSEQFGGGGHVPAAGCSLFVPMAEAVNAVLRAVERELEAA